ncbi:broad specificity phosphatase PhoE [Litoreibacter meonggei]|uniref:Broad specificity phosphatase PhoE n=1 Tax=Litoreibacter meonggei TaxID=1049199 RepID=A0A497VNQ6_9RHOB|nr:histidine phosphatase family protein [Litoreibacter meonggei]RLJ41825.1 broad specificity phosphatase PhoE [Litoreibacter meonggei]
MSIHLIRHGQSAFNAVFTGAGDPMIFDAGLTPLGHEQATAARIHVAELGIREVICSPLTRALQTARLIFPTDHIHVVAETREHLGHSCDVGRAPAALQAVFPDISFSHLPDIWWHQGELNAVGVPVEPADVFEARMVLLASALRARDARPLAVVCHGHVIDALTGTHPDNCGIVELRN